jgi:hypothetical protein
MGNSGRVPAACARVAPSGRDDYPFGEKLVGDEDGLVEQAAGVVAEVEHQALEPSARRARKLVEGTGYLVARTLLEALEREVPNAVVHQARLDAGDVHHLTDEFETYRFALSATLKRYTDA